MSSAPNPAKPVVSALQQAWLAELGVDKRLLASLSRQPLVLRPQSASVAAPAKSSPEHRAGPQALAGLLASVKGATQPRAARPDERRVALSGQELAARSSANATERVAKPAPQSSPKPPANLAPVAAGQLLVDVTRQALASDWPGLQQQVAVCQACALHAERHLPVFGSGATQKPGLMVIGEAPGRQDDQAGQPFQGEAGRLLQAMLKAIAIDGEQSVFYTNVLKCRPPANRAPQAAELASCLPYVQRQIALLQPARLLLLGEQAAAALLGEHIDIAALRGKLHAVEVAPGQTVPAVVTYPPAYLLSRPQFKLRAWQDLQLLASGVATD